MLADIIRSPVAPVAFRNSGQTLYIVLPKILSKLLETYCHPLSGADKESWQIVTAVQGGDDGLIFCE